MYNRASQIENILRKEKEREKGNIPEKRKDGVGQASGTPSGFYQKKAKHSAIFKEAGLVQILDLRENQSLLSQYWI